MHGGLEAKDRAASWCGMGSLPEDCATAVWGLAQLNAASLHIRAIVAHFWKTSHPPNPKPWTLHHKELASYLDVWHSLACWSPTEAVQLLRQLCACCRR